MILQLSHHHHEHLRNQPFITTTTITTTTGITLPSPPSSSPAHLHPCWYSSHLIGRSLASPAASPNTTRPHCLAPHLLYFFYLLLLPTLLISCWLLTYFPWAVFSCLLLFFNHVVDLFKHFYLSFAFTVFSEFLSFPCFVFKISSYQRRTKYSTL